MLLVFLLLKLEICFLRVFLIGFSSKGAFLVSSYWHNVFFFVLFTQVLKQAEVKLLSGNSEEKVVNELPL